MYVNDDTNGRKLLISCILKLLLSAWDYSSYLKCKVLINLKPLLVKWDGWWGWWKNTVPSYQWELKKFLTRQCKLSYPVGNAQVTVYIWYMSFRLGLIGKEGNLLWRIIIISFLNFLTSMSFRGKGATFCLDPHPVT